MVNLKPGSPNREAFFKLLSTADVLLDTFRPGVMKKLGLDYESLHPIYPKLILCSITGNLNSFVHFLLDFRHLFIVLPWTDTNPSLTIQHSLCTYAFLIIFF